MSTNSVIDVSKIPPVLVIFIAEADGFRVPHPARIVITRLSSSFSLAGDAF